MRIGEVRHYAETDKGAVRDICYRTGYMGESAARFWRHRPSFVEVWTSYYLEQEPSSAYVAVLDGAVVGYLTGCVNTALAPQTDDRLYRAITKYWLLFRPGTAGFLYRGIVDSIRDRQAAEGDFLDPRWPAHLHINLLPVARGTGLAAGLMQRWLDQLRQIGSPGCHLSTIAENARAVSFFERMGFRERGDPAPIPGMRGVEGERLHQQIMVWTAPVPGEPSLA